MAKTAAERQAEYRQRHGSNDTESRINVMLPVTVVTKLRQLAEAQGLQKKVMLERLIMKGLEVSADSDRLLERLAEDAGMDTRSYLEQLIADAGRKYQLPAIHALGSPTQIARELMRLYDRDGEIARREYRAYLHMIYPNWQGTVDKESSVSKLFHNVISTFNKV